MMEKIEWYQEVLEIEPSSKVFFPLAKLLAGNNQVQKSIAVLQQGLDRHPEFFEARLMLIDLLQQEQAAAAAVREVKELGAKLIAYPGFWDAWAGSVAADDDKDLATALRLMAAFLRHNDLSWSDIINQGLAALIGSAAQATVAPAAQPCAPVREPVRDEFSSDAAQEEPQPDVVAEEIENVLEPSDAGGDVLAADISFESVGPESPADFPADEDESEDEQFSLRTKSMATVFAEQGDYAGAKEIYEEILAATSDPDAREDLEGRIADLAAKIKSGHAAASPDAPEEPADQGKNKLIQVLERLAGRLENRVDKA